MWSVFAVTILAVAALLLNWSMNTGLQCDELLFLRAIELGPIQGLTAIGSSHPPLFRWIVGALFDSQSSDWLLRLPSVICALATVWVWFVILRKLFDDSRLVMIALPLVVCNSAWIDIAYQLTPYSFLTLVVSVHGLMWLRLIDQLYSGRASRWTQTAFVLSGAATFWTHFYGIHILIADQLIWILLVIRHRTWWKTWLSMSACMALLAAPVLPIAMHYKAIESGVTIVHIANFSKYFIDRSILLFSQVTWNLDMGGELLLLWYAMVAGFLASWLMRCRKVNDKSNTATESAEQAYILVLCGFFVAGFVAMQCQSILSRKGMWERYLVLGAWVHWPLLLAMLQSGRWSFLSSFPVQRVALAGLIVSFSSLVNVYGLYPKWTIDQRPIVAALQANARPGDAYFAQDKEIWIGPANYDRLWLKRYAPIELTIVTGPAVSGWKLHNDGLDWTAVPPSVNRVWVCSDSFSEAMLREMQTNDWRVVQLHAVAPYRPLALFERSKTMERELSKNDSVAHPADGEFN
jgi:hypothetical protein